MLVPSAEVSPGLLLPSPSSLGHEPLGQCIPPERVGLHGEYDHQGLAKRVREVYQQQFGPTALEGLRVRQRGSVIVLWGTMPATLNQDHLVQVAMAVEGTTHVDVRTLTD